MINTETKLEQLFDDMLHEMISDAYDDVYEFIDYQAQQGNNIDLILDINLKDFVRFMRYCGICQYALMEQWYYDGDKDEYFELSEEHQKALQNFCDLYAKDGFKFEVSLNPVALLWTKDGEYIDESNFDEINNELTNNSQKRIRKC